MNTPDLTTVAAGQIRDEIKRNIEEAMAHEQREVSRRMLIAEAAQWLRLAAPGNALNALEKVLADYEREDREAIGEPSF